MSYLDRIAECNRHDRGRYVPLRMQGERVGWVRRDRLEVLEGLADVLLGDDVVVRGDDFDTCTAAMERIVAHLVRTGQVRPPMGEAYAVAPRFADAPVAAVDRTAVAWFGIAARGVHLNGFVRCGADVEMWVAFRSRQKSTFPGMLDNMVAGGQPLGLAPRDNVVKECAEEAGIPAEIAARAIPVGAISYVAEHDKGLKPDTMFCYDLELPADFEPFAADGEVERFERWGIARVAQTVRDTARFKFNCNLVIIDFLVRHGLLTPEDPDYAEIVGALRRPAPNEQS